MVGIIFLMKKALNWHICAYQGEGTKQFSNNKVKLIKESILGNGNISL